MATNDEFWLLIHDMANAVNSDHAPLSEKAEILAGYFTQYPPVARKQIAEEFRLVLGVLMEIDPKLLVSQSIGNRLQDGDGYLAGR